MSHERLPPKPLYTDFLDNHQKACVEVMLESDLYQSITSYREQCHVMHNFLVKTSRFSNRMCARLLKVDHKTFEKQVRLPIEPRPPGRPTILTPEEMASVFDQIDEMHSRQEHPTIKDIQQLIIEICSKVPSIEVVRKIIKESDRYKIVKGIPMDALRVRFPKDKIDEYFRRLEEAVNGVPASLVLNVDEADEDDYCDLHSYQVIVS